MRLDSFDNFMERIFWVLIGSLLTLSIVGANESENFAWEMLGVLLALMCVTFLIFLNGNLGRDEIREKGSQDG